MGSQARPGNTTQYRMPDCAIAEHKDQWLKVGSQAKKGPQVCDFKGNLKCFLYLLLLSLAPTHLHLCLLPIGHQICHLWQPFYAFLLVAESWVSLLGLLLLWLSSCIMSCLNLAFACQPIMMPSSWVIRKAYEARINSMNQERQASMLLLIAITQEGCKKREGVSRGWEKKEDNGEREKKSGWTKENWREGVKGDEERLHLEMRRPW